MQSRHVVDVQPAAGYHRLPQGRWRWAPRGGPVPLRVAFGRLAEICGDYLKKGRLVYVEGKLRTREWEARDGGRRYTTEVVADTLQMLSPRHTGADGEISPVEAGEPVPA
jgi:hypothetical protein